MLHKISNFKAELCYMASTSQLVVPKTWNIRCNINSLIVLLAVVFVLGIFATTKQSRRWLFDQKTQRNTHKHSLLCCDLFSGKWVYDEKNYPLYKEQHCSFMSLFNGVACERSGRMDLKYQHWTWQPHECDLPRSLFLSLPHTHTLCFEFCEILHVNKV